MARPSPKTITKFSEGSVRKPRSQSGAKSKPVEISSVHPAIMKKVRELLKQRPESKVRIISQTSVLIENNYSNKHRSPFA